MEGKDLGTWDKVSWCDGFQMDRAKFLERAKQGRKFVTPKEKHLHMPKAEFDRLLNHKGFQKCHICLNRSYLLVDHCHRTRVVRGLLCNSCNLMVGDYEHSREVPTLMKLLIVKYLDNPPARQLGMHYEYRAYYPEQMEA